MAEGLRALRALLARGHHTQVSERAHSSSCPIRSSACRARSSSPSPRAARLLSPCSGAATSGRSSRRSRSASSATLSTTSRSCGSPYEREARSGSSRCASPTASPGSSSAFTGASRPIAGAGAGSWSVRTSPRGSCSSRSRSRRSTARCRSVGARRRRVPARDRDELLHSRLRRHDPGTGRPGERAGCERARAGDGAGALGRRLGGRGRPAHLPAAQHLLRDRRRDLPRLGALILRIGAGRGAATAPLRGSARGSTRSPTPHACLRSGRTSRSP